MQRERIGFWPYTYKFTMQGTLGTYTTSWYQGSGWGYIIIPVLGVYVLDYAAAELTNSAGFRLFRTYTEPGFTESFYYPYPRDNEGGPRSELEIGWHYVNVYER